MPRLLATVAPGLEPVVARELSEHGLTAQIEPGRLLVSVPDLPAVSQLAHRLRTPSRLLLPVAEGHAPNLDALARLVRSAEWSSYLRRSTPVSVTVRSQRARIRRTDAAKKKVAHALNDALRGGPSAPRRGRADPEQHVRVHLKDDHATVSIDIGGLLHRRGWRTDGGRAPLRENLAACLLVMAGWQGDESLIDPFCGAGTLPIEAARLAHGLSPHLKPLACAAWPALASHRLQAPSPRLISVPIVGSDHHTRAVERSSENAVRASVSVEFIQRDVAELTPPPGTGVVVSNPPYGARLGRDASSVLSVYRTFGHSLRRGFSGWRALFLAPSPRHAHAVDRAAECLTTFSNGGSRVGVWALVLD